MSSESPAIFSQEYKAPPILTPGVLIPALLCAFQIGASQYFVQKNVPNNKCVAQVIWDLCDPHIQNWHIDNMACINALDFGDFMNEIRANSLVEGWEGVIELSILVNAQGDKPFWDWLQELQATNAFITCTYAELDEASLQTQIKANLNKTLKKDAAHKRTH
jgi:hypothetical protein